MAKMFLTYSSLTDGFVKSIYRSMHSAEVLRVENAPVTG
jgi:hypothetical protein